MRHKPAVLSPAAQSPVSGRNITLNISRDEAHRTPRLPERVDIVIIGGGIIGASAAFFLSQRGVAVALCEKGHIGCEQSTRNWGWCRKMGRDPAEIPLAIASARLWERMNELVGAETGFRKTGIFYLCKTRREIEKYEAWLQHARQYQLDSVMLTPAEIADKLPGMAGSSPGALYTPSDGRAEPSLATAAIAAAAGRAGAGILENCAVRGIETAAGSLSSVITEHGPIACRQVVIATGAWTRLFCGNMGLDFPQLKVTGSVMRTTPVEGAPDCALAGADFAFRRRLDGGYTVAQKNANIAQIVPDSFRLLTKFLPAFRSEGNEIRLRFGRAFFDELKLAKRWSMTDQTPFEKHRTLDPSPSPKILAEGLRNLVRDFPAFASARIVEQWAGAIDVTPDAVPVISPVASVPGLLIASGFSGHGFGIAPGAGHLIADLVTNAEPIVDPAPYRLSRIAKETRQQV